MARQKEESTGKKTRWYHNVWQAYQLTRETDPAVTWWMLGVFLLIMGAAIGIGFAFGQIVYLVIVGFPFALLAVLLILVRRTESAAYKRIEGQPGASLSALRTIRRGWEFGDDPVAMDPRTQDLVFRGVGRPGVVLVSEGPKHRVTPMLEKERKRVARVLPRVPITLIQCGDDQGQVPLAKLAREVQRLRPALNKHVVAEVNRRLRALGGARLPVPKGIDPFKVRPDRRAVRGR